MKVKRRKDSSLGFLLLLVLLLVVDFTVSSEEESSETVVLYIYGESQKLIDFNENSQIVNFTIIAGPLNVVTDYKISLVLEYMSARCEDVGGPEIIVTEAPNSRVGWCLNVDHFPSYDNVYSLSSGHDQVKVVMAGNWSEAQARLVATIYYEVDDCSNCDSGTFCCSGESCKGSSDINNRFLRMGSSDPGVQKMSRCISNELICNGHANCGMNCNADESLDQCEDDCNTIASGCSEDWHVSFFWTAILAVVFFIMAPTVVIFLICYHRHFSALQNRSRSGGPVTVESPENDRPPTYDEIVPEEPPPCFCYATSQMGSLESGGVDNPSFEPDSMTPQKPFRCVCGSNNKPEPGTDCIV